MHLLLVQAKSLPLPSRSHSRYDSLQEEGAFRCGEDGSGDSSVEATGSQPLRVAKEDTHHSERLGKRGAEDVFEPVRVRPKPS